MFVCREQSRCRLALLCGQHRPTGPT